MKRLNQIIKTLLLGIILISLNGCLDIYLNTEVHPNGQIDKTIILEGDSTSILNSYIPAVTDPAWKAVWDSIDKDKHRLSLTKSFRNYKDFNISMNPDDSIPKIRVKAELRKKLRWFFSYIEYQEFLLPNNPFKRLDWEEYLTTDEIELIAMDEENREEDPRFDEDDYPLFEKKFEEYLYRSSYEDFYYYFSEALKKTPEAGLSMEDLTLKKEEIYKEIFSNENIEESEDFLVQFRTLLDSTAVNKIVEANPDFIEYFDKKIDFFDECLDDNYYFNIKMPGLLVNTNSTKIEGSTLSWEVDFFDFYFKGLEMTAESRLINIWAFIVAGLVVLALFTGILWNMFSKRKKK